MNSEDIYHFLIQLKFMKRGNDVDAVAARRHAKMTSGGVESEGRNKSII